MQVISLNQILYLHKRIIETTGGSSGIRDLKMLESALAQPFMTFHQKDLYTTIIDKAASLGFSLIMNHPFVDGNKRIGHAAMELFLYQNGYEIIANLDEQEQIILNLASGNMTREKFTKWLKKSIRKTAE